MHDRDRVQIRLFALIGLALLYAQQVERAIEFILNTVLKDTSVTIESLTSDAEKEGTRSLGYFMRELRKRTRIDRAFNQKLYRFLKMRNTFVHNLSEVPGWNLDTEEGQEASARFLFELISLSLGITGVLASLLTISMREEFGEELAEGNQILAFLEKSHGETARGLFLGMNRKRIRNPPRL